MMKNQQGVSLVELLLVIVVIASVVLLLSNIPNALSLINKSKHSSLAREIAAKQIEDKRVIKYANLVNDSSPILDSRLNLLPQGNGTVTVEDCDPKICTNGEHVKQITITVSWQDNNKSQTVTLKTMISEGGLNQ